MKALLAMLCGAVAVTSAAAAPRQVVGYAGVLGEWELVATVDEAAGPAGGEFHGPVTLSHVGLCTQDGPERRSGEIRLQLSPSQLKAKLSLSEGECTYTGRGSEGFDGTLICPGRPNTPLKLWLRSVE